MEYKNFNIQRVREKLCPSVLQTFFKDVKDLRENLFEEKIVSQTKSKEYRIQKT